MRIEKSEKSVVFTVFDAPKLDPITVVLQDHGRGSGRLIVECWGKAWSAYWGGMGDKTVSEFVVDCGPDYIVSKLAPPDRKMKKADEAYLRRIVDAMQEALMDFSIRTQG